MMPSTAIRSALGLIRCAAPNNADERPSAHHTPNALQSSRKIAPRKISSSTVPSSEPISACQGAAAVGPVIAYAPVASSTTMMAEKSATPKTIPAASSGASCASPSSSGVRRSIRRTLNIYSASAASTPSTVGTALLPSNPESIPTPLTNLYAIQSTIPNTMPQGVWINVTPHPTADWIARQIAVRLGRTASPKDLLIDPTRVPRPCDRLGRGAPTRDSASLCPLLQRFENAPIVGQRRAILAPGSADRSHQVACCSPVHASLSFRYTQVGGAPTFWAP